MAISFARAYTVPRTNPRGWTFPFAKESAVGKRKRKRDRYGDPRKEAAAREPREQSEHRPQPTQQVENTRGINIVGQYGGTIGSLDIRNVQIGGVRVIHAPKPSVHVRTEAEYEPEDDAYLTRFAVHLDAPYAARNLAVFAKGAGVKMISVNRVDPSASLVTGSITDGERRGVIVGAPLTSDYRVFVVTEHPDAGLEVEARLNVEVVE
jgi:hypothetical protein